MASETKFLSTNPYLDVEDASKGLRARFEKGVFSTDDADVIAFLESLPYFGVSVVKDGDDVDDKIKTAIHEATKGPLIVADSVTTGSKAANATETITGRIPIGVETELPGVDEDTPPPVTTSAPEEIIYAEEDGEAKPKRSRTPKAEASGKPEDSGK